MRYVDSAIYGDFYGGKDVRGPMTNLANTTYGPAPIVGAVGSNGTVWDNWYSAQPYVSKSMVPYLVHFPKAMLYAPNGDKQLAILKALMTKAKQITGINTQLSVDFHKVPFDASGNEISTPSGVKKATSNPSYTWDEKYGKACSVFWENFIRLYLGDDLGQAPLISNYLPADFKSIYGPDFDSISVLYIEYDVTGRTPVDAVLCLGMYPDSSGQKTMELNRFSGGQGHDISISFGGFAYNNDAVFEIANRVAYNEKLYTKNSTGVFMPDTNELASYITAASTYSNS